MEDQLVLAHRSKKSMSRYVVSVSVFIVTAIVFYLITYVFKTAAPDRLFTFTAIIIVCLAAIVYYGFFLVRIFTLPKELIVLYEGELIIKGRIRIEAGQIKDVSTKYGIGSNPKFSFGKLLIVTKDNKRIIVPEVEDVAAMRQTMHDVLRIL